MQLGKDKRVCFADEVSKKNLSPGPAKHSYENKALNMISLSPNISRKRI